MSIREETQEKHRRAGRKGATPKTPDSAPPSDGWTAPTPLNLAPPAAGYPTHVYPDALRRFAEQAAGVAQCPVDYIAAPMLALAGGAVGASKAVAIKRGYVQRGLVYMAVVGPPGDAKTPAMGLVASPVYEAQQRARAAYKMAMEAYEEKKGADREERPAKPTMLRVHVDDATVESLAPILLKNPRGVVMIRDELAAWVTSANQYKNGRGSDKQFWLSNWSGLQACVDRKGQEDPIILPHPFVAVVGGIQPDVLSVLADPRGRQDGSLDRILFVYPDGRPAPRWTWDELPDESLTPWRDAVRELLALSMDPGEHGPRPHLVKLTNDARPEWQALMNSLVDEMNAPDFPPSLRGPWAKFKVYAARLALIVHFLRFVAKEAPSQDVDGESVRRAALLIDYFKSHTRKVMAFMGADPKAAAGRRVLLCLARNRSLTDFTRTDLYKLMRGTFDEPGHLDGPLSLLIAHHYLLAYTPDRANKPGPNPPRYKVNPLWDRVTDAQDAPVTQDAGDEGDGNPTSATSATSAQGEEEEHGDAWEPVNGHAARQRSPFSTPAVGKSAQN